MVMMRMVRLASLSNAAMCEMQIRFRNAEETNLEFAENVEDTHLTVIALHVSMQINTSIKVTNQVRHLLIDRKIILVISKGGKLRNYLKLSRSFVRKLNTSVGVRFAITCLAFLKLHRANSSLLKFQFMWFTHFASCFYNSVV